MIHFKQSYFKAGVTPEGKLEFVSLLFYSDGGYVSNEAEVSEAVRFAKNCYDSKSWSQSPTIHLIGNSKKLARSTA